MSECRPDGDGQVYSARQRLTVIDEMVVVYSLTEFRFEWWDCNSARGSLFATDVIRVLAMAAGGAERDQFEGGVGGNRNGQGGGIRVDVLSNAEQKD